MLRVGLGRVTPINARTTPPASFFLPFTDGGAGSVSLIERAFNTTPTFTRATTATTIGSTGLVVGVASGTARSYYDPTSLAYLGYLAEGSRINLCLQSEVITNASWTKTASVAVADQTTSPDGTVTADKLREDNTTAFHVATQSIAFTSGTAYTFSVFLKASERTTSRLQLSDVAAFPANAFGDFNLSAGTVAQTGAGATSATIKAYPNSWYLCSVTATADATANSDATIVVGTTSTAGDNTSGIFIWGAQVEAGAFASSYMPTTVASFTRNADVLTYPIPTGLNTQGTAFAVFTKFPVITGTGILLGSGGGGAGQILTIASGSALTIFDGVNNPTLSAGPFTAGVPAKIATAWDGVTSSGCANGGTVGSGAFDGDLGFTGNMGVLAYGGGATFGAVSSIRYFPQRLSNSVLQQITT